MRNLRDDTGNILVLTALSITLLVSILAIAVDAGYLFYSQRQLQTLADAAAMAGALEVSACSGTTDCGVITTAAKSALTESGVTATVTLKTQCAAQTVTTGVLLTVNNGPCALGSTASDPNYGSASYVEAVVAENKPTFFSSVFGIGTVKLSARAEAGKAAPAAAADGPCLLATATSGTAVTVNSNGSIKDGKNSDGTTSTCALNVNSSSTGTCKGGTPAMMVNGSVTVSSTNLVGGICDTNGGAVVSPSPATDDAAAKVSDPYALELTAGTLTVPAKGATQYEPAPNQTQLLSTVGGKTTLSPGYYPNGLNFNSSGYTVTLNPGVYYMGGGVNIGDITINGTGGVTIYMASGQLNMNSAATVNLTAPSTGDTAGMVIWQASSDTDEMNLDSGSNSSWEGAVYVPGAELTLNSDSTTSAYGMVIANQVMVDSNATISLSCSYMPGGVCPGGAGGGGGAANGSTATVLAE